MRAVVTVRLARPIIDNKVAFTGGYPGAVYAGDRGDAAHLAGAGDHTWYSKDVIFGRSMRPGYVFAQDLGSGGEFDLARFTRWLLRALRGGAYPEVKYVISRIEANRGVDGGIYYGLFDRRYQWRTQRSTGHTKHLHLSYMPDTENKPSTIVADYHAGIDPLRRAGLAEPAWKRWAGAPALPALGLGRYSTRELDRLPYTAYPPMVRGYGGPEQPGAQSDVVRALLAYARGLHTRLITPAEIERVEFGSGFIAFAKMLAGKAGNPWGTDPLRNARAFGAAIGAPASW